MLCLLRVVAVVGGDLRAKKTARRTDAARKPESRDGSSESNSGGKRMITKREEAGYEILPMHDKK